MADRKQRHAAHSVSHRDHIHRCLAFCLPVEEIRRDGRGIEAQRRARTGSEVHDAEVAGMGIDPPAVYAEPLSDLCGRQKPVTF